MGLERRRFLIGAAAGSAGLAAGVTVSRVLDPGSPSDGPAFDAGAAVAFRGVRQAGIETPGQRHGTLAAFDVVERDGPAMQELLAAWTEAADVLASGGEVSGDSGESTGLGPARLTITFGFGPSFFDDQAAPRSARPEALVDLPAFPGDALEEPWNGGDLVVQVCADDPTVVSHAVRQLRRIGSGRVALRWMQNGFLPQTAGETPRNLFGQVDGTANPPVGPDMDALVWTGAGDGPAWMAGGTYMAVRRIRMNLTMWDRMPLGVQEASVGRDRRTGAPLSGGDEFTEPDLDAEDGGLPVIADDAHIRIARTTGPGMLRRGYSFDNGPREPDVTGLAIPAAPDHSDHEMDPGPMGEGTAPSEMMDQMGAAMDDHDAGLLFVAFVRDPSTQFVPMQQALSEDDALGHFLIYTSAGLWAVPPGAEDGPIAAGLYA